MQQIALISTFVAVSVAQFGGYQPQQGNYGFGGGPQQQQQGGFMQQGREQWGQQGQQQQWGGDRGMMNGGMDSMMGGMGGHHRRGPPFLQNVTRQAVSEYYQIYMNRNLTKAQIQTAVGNWSTTYNVADQVTAFNTQKQQAQQQGRQNVTAAVQQLPSTLTQIYSIMDNQNLTPAQEHQQIGQIFSNQTYPLNMLTGSALQGGKRGKDGMGGGRRGDDDNSGEELVIFGF
ncbi:hypothetical protein PRIPAC_78088 [Pristionchus pacificus]|uniref:DUF148 domain-containing protein n=1 Tax=Pristionchus pacificus TaxID=54126 RepID=A0A454XW44_PRIPA|nr:hypothetical protein PRIPAC_78088 [Pristionchus pacificus]|eukprot:PDM79409.1 hypothetical protein PRIPAC_31988 [Pristionchus pacificus]